LYEEAARLAEDFEGDSKRADALQQRAKAGLAIAAEVRGDWESARKHLEAWLAEDPDNAAALQRLGRTLFELGQIDEALESLQAAIENSDSTIAPEAILAQYFERDGDEENSTKWMIEALKAKPQDLPTRLAAVQWAIETDQLDQAAEQAKLALQLDPDSLQAQLLRGVVALLTEDYETAEKFFQQAHIEEPGNFAASNNLALALVEQDDESKQARALQYAQMNARQFPNVAEAASTLGWVLYKLDRKQEAEQALRKAFSRGNVSADTRYYMARLYADTDREDEARQLLEQALATESTFSKRAEAEALMEELKQ
jgi:tetratricopeptide (TPR) repeat protein